MNLNFADCVYLNQTPSKNKNIGHIPGRPKNHQGKNESVAKKSKVIKLQKATWLVQKKPQGNTKQFLVLLSAMKEASDQELPGTPQPGDPLPGRGNRNFPNSDSARCLSRPELGMSPQLVGQKGLHKR